MKGGDPHKNWSPAVQRALDEVTVAQRPGLPNPRGDVELRAAAKETETDQERTMSDVMGREHG